jgi:hypothetical protein
MPALAGNVHGRLTGQATVCACRRIEHTETNMKHSIFLAGLVAGGALAVAGSAQAAGSSMTARADMAQAQQARAQVQARAVQAKTAAAKSGAAGAKPGGTTAAELYANPYRAYPPSCLGSPIPLGLWQNDPNAITKQPFLFGDPYAGGLEASYYEKSLIYLFRVPCSGGKSATLLEIDRPSTASTTYYPTFPAVSVAQGSNNIYIRLTDDPNTFFSTVYALNPLIQSDVFVLENYYGDGVQFDYNQAFTLTVDNLSNVDSGRISTFSMPAYNPAQYAAASQPLPISGYMTGNWRDPNHSGQGIQVEVGELQSTSTSYPRYITIAWYTFDDLGVPYWLFGSGTFNAGDTSAAVQLGYSSGGAFAGSSGGSATAVLWGTFNVQFTDCNTMQFSYQSTGGLPAGVPSGSGTRTFQRLTQMNGLTCQ